MTKVGVKPLLVGRCLPREFKLPWREAGPPNHHDDKVDSDQEVVNTELSLYLPGIARWSEPPAAISSQSEFGTCKTARARFWPWFSSW